MPLLGDVFLNTVYSEGLGGSVKSTDHPIEDGGSVTDHIEIIARELDISGVVVGPDAPMRKLKLEGYKNKGTLLKYSYRNVLQNVIITDFKTEHDAEVAGGFKYDITLKEIKISKATIIKNVPAKAKPVSNKGLQQPTKGKPAKVHVVKKGDTPKKIEAKHGAKIKQYKTGGAGGSAFTERYTLLQF